MRLVAILLAGCLVCGCSSKPAEKPAAGGSGHDHGHDHGGHDHHGHSHGHDHAAGPHEGHVLVLGDHKYHLEWTHDDASGLVTLYVLDAEMKEEVPIAAESLTIDVVIGDKTRQHTLAAVEPADGQASQFATTDKPLIEALKMAGHGVEAHVQVPVDGETYTVSFEHEAH